MSYELQWRQLISRYKFHAELGLAVALAERMRTLPALKAQWAHFDALVPIPMDRRALSARGFNAAERLAHRLDASRVQLHLRRSHATQAPSMAQHQLSRAQRLRNMTGAFHTPDHLHLDGQRLLLIDDVMTTGATLQAATRALLNAGAAHVEVLVFARTEATPAP